MQAKLEALIVSENAFTSIQINDFNLGTGKFANAIVINMASRTERLELATYTLNKVMLPFERFIAINGKQLNEKDTSWTERFPLLRPGELGCLLSHLGIAALAANHPDQNAFTIIFEDDIVTSTGDISGLLTEIEELDVSETFDLIYFGKCFERCGQMVNIQNNIYRAVAPSCCHAYAIRNSFAKKILSDMDNCDNSAINCEYFNRGIDSIYGDTIINGLSNAIVIHPAVFYQNVLTGGSDLRTEYMANYQECNDTYNSSSIPSNQEFNDTYNSSSIPSNQVWIGQNVKIIIALVIAILLILLFYNRSYLKSIAQRILDKRIFLIFLIIIIVIVSVLILKTKRKVILKPDNFTFNASLPTIMTISQHEPVDLQIDNRMIANKKYNTFNPNAILFENDLICTLRCSNNKNSYPILQILDPQTFEIRNARKVQLKSPKTIVNTDHLGFEDMRIFTFQDQLYMIGVNLDRREDRKPSMVLTKLTQDLNHLGILNQDIWHLNYEPVAKFPNKNWSPLTLPNGELGFIIDIDPLLIVKRKRVGSEFVEECELAYEAEKQVDVVKLRNSTITYNWNDIPENFKLVLNAFSSVHVPGTSRYVLMGHTKYVEQDYILHGTLIMYQQYFVVIDISQTDEPKVYISKPFHLEVETNPHIEYVSGFTFLGDKMILMYGLEDSKSRYLTISSDNLSKFLSE